MGIWLASSIPGLGRSPGEWKGYPLQHSCQENSMNWRVHGVAKSLIQLSEFHFHFQSKFHGEKMTALAKSKSFHGRVFSIYSCKCILHHFGKGWNVLMPSTRDYITCYSLYFFYWTSVTKLKIHIGERECC